MFFSSFAAVLAGLAIHLTWSLVAAANSRRGCRRGRWLARHLDLWVGDGSLGRRRSSDPVPEER